VEAVFKREKFCTKTASSGAKTTGVGARELECSFPGFNAAVGEEDAVKATDLCEPESEFCCVFMEKEIGGVEEALALTVDRFFDGGVSIAKRRHSDAAEEIEIVVAVFVAEINALSTDKQIGVALIRVKEKLFLRCLNRC
jgi:hypothetical protein